MTYRQLVARFGCAAEALSAVPDLARRGGGKAPQLCSRDMAEREIARVEKLGAEWLARGRDSIRACWRKWRMRRRRERVVKERARSGEYRSISQAWEARKGNSSPWW